MKTITGFAGSYSDQKTQIVEATGGSQELLHVHVGLVIFVLAALVLRGRPRSAVPLALVAFFAAGNEVIDWFVSRPEAIWEPLMDFANTVFWPAILFFLLRRWR